MQPATSAAIHMATDLLKRVPRVQPSYERDASRDLPMQLQAAQIELLVAIAEELSRLNTNIERRAR